MELILWGQLVLWRVHIRSASWFLYSANPGCMVGETVKEEVDMHSWKDGHHAANGFA